MEPGEAWITAWNPAVLSVGTPVIGSYSLTTPFSFSTSDYTFHLTNVYAPSNHSETDAFLAELMDTRPPQHCPWIVVGDFNLTHSPADKNMARFNWPLANRFNDLIDGLALIELPYWTDYTWSNKRPTPTLARHDRAFVNTDFSSKFPNTSLSSCLGNPSDHPPHGDHPHVPSQSSHISF
jgi:endonuclease/exonuclease/phosphatase family metal-dependent hydrolase